MTVAPWPSTIPTKSGIIDEIGRDVTFHVIYSSQACPSCGLDPVTNESTDSFCEICSGIYWIPTYSGITYKAHVTWKFADQQQWETTGIILAGDAQVKIMYDTERDNTVSNAKFVVVDERVMDVEKITYRGATEIDRIIVDLKEREKDE